MIKRTFRIFLTGAALSVAPLAQAEVTNSAANGFTVEHQTLVAGDSEAVWKAMIAPSQYWSPDHSWTGKSENFYLVPQAGGCFCELIRGQTSDNIKSSDGSVQHMRVIYAHNNKMLRLSGALGPLQSEAVTGTLTMQLLPQGASTMVRFTYKVGGYMEFPVEQIAPAVDSVIGEQLMRLSALFAVEEKSDTEPTEKAEPSKEEKAINPPHDDDQN